MSSTSPSPISILEGLKKKGERGCSAPCLDQSQNGSHLGDSSFQHACLSPGLTQHVALSSWRPDTNYFETLPLALSPAFQLKKGRSER